MSWRPVVLASDPGRPRPAFRPGQGQDGTKHDGQGLPFYRDLLAHLAAVCRQAITFVGRAIEKFTSPALVQRRAFELLGTTVHQLVASSSTRS